mgnify:CR=1 FL=1
MAAISIPLDPVKVAYIARQIKLAKDMDNDITKAEFNLAAARTPAQRMKITNDIINLHNTQDGLFQDVIRQTLELYHIAPPLKHQTIVAGPFFGSEAHWDPKFGRLDHRMVKNEETGKYIPLIYDKESAAVTWHDGRIELSREVFKSPGFLASVLYHEAIHFEQLTTKGQGDEMSDHETEYKAYMMQRSKRIDFQLTESEVKDITDRLHRRLSHPVIPGWRFGGAWTKDYDGLEHEKHQGETDFLRGISGLPETTQEALDAFERDERLQRLAVEPAAAERARLDEREAAERARLAEEARLKKEKADVMEAYAKSVRWYKFEPVLGADGFSTGFQSFDSNCRPSCSKAVYSFTSEVTLEEARMALLFAYTCHGQGINEDNRAAFAEILVIINKRWSDPDYRDKMDLKTDRDDQSACLAHLHEHIKTPVDLKNLDKAAVRFWRDWDKARDREYDRAREARRRSEAAEARRRRQEERAEERESRGSGPGGGYINPCIAPGKHCWGNNPPHGP